MVIHGQGDDAADAAGGGVRVGDPFTDPIRSRRVVSPAPPVHDI